MKTELLEFIKTLSLADPKSLSHKALKLDEESGELAKAVLPYESARGTLHRVVSKEKILEESIDTILVALSIAYSLGYEDDAIAAMLNKKAMYWQQIQQTENAIDLNKIPHELHFTVASVSDHEKFVSDCEIMGVKPVILHLHSINSNEVQLEMMTSQIVICSTLEAIQLAEKTTTALAELGYDVIRSKIETTPWHPSVPTDKNGLNIFSKNYFEVHIEVVVDDNDPTRSFEALKQWIAFNWTDLSLSINIRKKAENGIRKAMITYRQSVCTLDDFKKKAELRRNHLITDGWNIDKKQVIEYAIYDTNPTHDDPWMGNS